MPHLMAQGQVELQKGLLVDSQLKEMGQLFVCECDVAASPLDT
jgi:hypothetical protein